MNPEASHTSVPASPADRFLPLLVFLFVGSGCAALIYEIVWFQMLSLIVGSSAISLGVLLATFMGGMCIGSVSLARVVPAQRHPLRVYAVLEAGVGIFGLLVLWLLPHVGGLYTSFGGPGMAGLVVRAFFCALFLLPPTIMMGATLPAISRWVRTTPTGVSWLGFFYGGNTFGAVAGCLLAGFYLLRLHDVAVATYAAVAVNAVVAAAAFALAGFTAYDPSEDASGAGPLRMAPGGSLVLVVIGISGATALGAEVVWTRLMALNFGGTTYTFSLILAAFLFGIGIGSGVGSFMARHLRDPRRALGWAQFLVVAGLAWAAYLLLRALPHWPVNPSISTPWFNFQLDFVRAVLTALPAAALWGASFPLALAAVAADGQDPGRLVGRVYAANTVGAIAGSLLSSIVMIAWVGTQTTQRVMIAFAALSAVLMLATRWSAQRGRFEVGVRGAAWTVVVGAVALVLARTVIPVPALLVGYGRFAPTYQDVTNITWVYVGEGMNSSMAVSELAGSGYRNYHNAGKVQASSEPQDMRLQRMLGHLTTLLPSQATSVMVIGCGAGVTAGAVSIDPAVEDLTIVEIEPLVPQVVSREFGDYNFNVVDNPKTTVINDDARHFLLTTDRKFDAITSDPFDPWVKGAATLYTVEFWQEAREHLNPGGVITVFVQLYESTMDAVKSEVATFLEVFPEGMVFANLAYGQGYDVVMVAQAEPGPIDLDAIDRKLASPGYEPMAESLAEVGFYSAAQLLATFAAKKPEIDPWLADAQVNRDRNLRLQYLAGLGMNRYEADSIYRDMAQYRTYPEGLFVGSPNRLAQLSAMWERSGLE